MRQGRAASTSGSVVREESQGKVMGTRGKCERGRGSCVASRGVFQGVGDAGKQPRGGRARAGTRRPRTLPSGARRKATEEGWWAGPACKQCWAQVSAFSLFLFSYFFFCFICFPTLFN